MNANEYQFAAGRTLIAEPGFALTGNEVAISRDALALAVSAGNVADLIKKQVFHRHGLDRVGLLTALEQVRANTIMLELALSRQNLADEPIDAATLFRFWNVLGLIGEAAEVGEQVLEGRPTATFHKELGDVLWYVAALCTKLDLTMDEVMSTNILKLKQRYPDGYSSDASKDWQATR